MKEGKSRVFFHASGHFPTIGTVFAGRGDAYERDWASVSFYQALERHRPEGMIAHKDAVFVCKDTETIGLCGGLAQSILLLRVESSVSWHDMSWSTEISRLVSDGFALDGETVRQAAMNYWYGKAHPDGPVWEGVADSATVVAVYPYLEDGAVLESARRRLEAVVEAIAA